MPTVSEVFVAGGVPRVTYVERNNLNLESKLSAALEDKFQIICITGPTKSGKSVLCLRVLNQRQSVWIEGGQVDSADDFWKIAAERLELPSEITTTNGSKSSGGIRYVVKIDRETNESEQVKYVSSAKQAVLATCRRDNIVLVVDDFHYMDPDIQKNVVRAVKSEILHGLDVILVAVPHRAFDAIAAEPEMQGRFIHLEIPSWAMPELEEIAMKGFPELHVQACAVDITDFAKESYGSPILMQRFCNNACKGRGIKQTVNPWVDLELTEVERANLYAAVAENSGFPTYKVLSDGPQTRTDRSPRQLRGSQETVDIYEAVLKAVAFTGPGTATAYNDIRDALRSILVEADLPQKQQVTNTLKYMAREAKDKLKGEPPIEWKDDVLYITDPMLQFYLRWRRIQ